MTSFSGSVAYLEYVATTGKNGMKGKTLNSVFALGEMDEARRNYTAELVVDKLAIGEKIGLTCMKSGKFEGEKDAKLVKISDGSVTYFTAEELNEYEANDAYKVYYFSEEFQMTHVPAKDIPSIGPVMKNIPLVAEPRRIAVVYDQITAFQAKQDYGFSLDKQIAEQACGELAY